MLAIAPAHNSPGKKDATGAFHPEARAFGGPVHLFDNGAPQIARLQETLRILRSEEQGACLGLFMHGFKTGLQCGAANHNVTTFAGAITAPRVALFACDAARDTDKDRKDDTQDGPGGSGGFASRLARALGPRALWVDAHSTAAHTTRNPFVRRFLCRDATDDGLWIVEPRSALWGKWRRRLQDDRAFRLGFPLMTLDEIRAAL